MTHYYRVWFLTGLEQVGVCYIQCQCRLYASGCVLVCMWIEEFRRSISSLLLLHWKIINMLIVNECIRRFLVSFRANKKKKKNFFCLLKLLWWVKTIIFLVQIKTIILVTHWHWDCECERAITLQHWQQK